MTTSKVVFDATTHMRGGGCPSYHGRPSCGPLVGTAIAGSHVNDYWFYLDYKNHAQNESALLVVPKILQNASSLRSPCVRISSDRDGFFGEGRRSQMDDLKALKSKQALKIDNRTIPFQRLSQIRQLW